MFHRTITSHLCYVWNMFACWGVNSSGCCRRYRSIFSAEVGVGEISRHITIHNYHILSQSKLKYLALSGFSEWIDAIYSLALFVMNCYFFGQVQDPVCCSCFERFHNQFDNMFHVSITNSFFRSERYHVEIIFHTSTFAQHIISNLPMTTFFSHVKKITCNFLKAIFFFSPFPEEIIQLFSMIFNRWLL